MTRALRNEKLQRFLFPARSHVIRHRRRWPSQFIDPLMRQGPRPMSPLIATERPAKLFSLHVLQRERLIASPGVHGHVAKIDTDCTREVRNVIAQPCQPRARAINYLRCPAARPGRDGDVIWKCSADRERERERERARGREKGKKKARIASTKSA